jgi:hypothetical protein
MYAEGMNKPTTLSAAPARGGGDSTEAPSSPRQRPLDREELGGRVVVVLGGSLIGNRGDALTQLLERGGQRGQLG